ncbi:MAG: hypothetical protein WD227_00545, partial [Vicinamibacterales bacterium]
MSRRCPVVVFCLCLGAAVLAEPARAQPAAQPFGTLREQAAMQQDWLKKRLDTFLAPLMRTHGIDMWVIPMREYMEDPVFTALVAPETFAARRRTIYVFFDTCAAAGTAPSAACVERIALGGTSQGGVFEARRSTQKAAGDVGRGQQAELWGDEQWQALKTVIEERTPKVIGINRSTVFAFSDGLTSGELQGMSAALGDAWTAKFRDAEALPLELIASRLPDEEAFFEKMTALVWSMTQEMFSSTTITPGTTKTSDLVWWWRQRVNALGLDTWFQPSVSVQRQGQTAEQIGSDPVIQRGDVLHCDVGITVARLNTDTQHNAYVLKDGETDAPAGLRQDERGEVSDHDPEDDHRARTDAGAGAEQGGEHDRRQGQSQDRDHGRPQADGHRRGDREPRELSGHQAGGGAQEQRREHDAHVELGDRRG